MLDCLLNKERKVGTHKKELTIRDRRNVLVLDNGSDEETGGSGMIFQTNVNTYGQKKKTNYEVSTAEHVAGSIKEKEVVKRINFEIKCKVGKERRDRKMYRKLKQQASNK